MKRLKPWLRAASQRKKILFGVGLVFCLFLLANLVLGLAYNSKTYPKTHVAHNYVGSVPFSDLEANISNKNLLPSEVELVAAGKSVTPQTIDLGIEVDASKTAEIIKNTRHWLPIWNLFVYSSTDYQLQTDESKLKAFAEKYSKTHSKNAVNATYENKDGSIRVKADQDGYAINPENAVEAISQAVSSGNSRIEISIEKMTAKITTKDLEPQLAVINKQLKTTITLKFNEKSKTFNKSELSSWYELDGSKATLDEAHIQSAVTATGKDFGILIANTAETVEGIKQAVSDARSVSLTLKEAPKPTRNYTYCVAARGISTNYLGTFSAKLASVFADSRGWGLSGDVTFSKVASGCDFTAWLSAASQMPTFGAICDSTWSCRVGSNVVINFDRWQNASPAWNQNGGSLDNYRSMVINHETGHWFGYYHSFCGGTGQLAPVMQQQSINLQGCKFNPWPTAGELVSHRQALGL